MKKQRKIMSQMNIIYRNIICMNVIALFVLLSISCTVHAGSCEVQKLEDARDAAQTLQKNWDDDYFDEMIVKEDSNKIDIDGDQETFTDTFSVSASTMKEAVASEENLDDFFEEEQEKNGDIYEVEETKDGVYAVSAPYQTKRIVVYSTSVSDTYGARNAYIYEEAKETILCYATEEDTKNAYEKIKARYGEDNCYVDKVFSTEDLTQSYSWGAAKMGMDTLTSSASAQTSLSKVTVAVIDTGITKKSSIFNDTTISSDSYNFVDGNRTLTDTCGHGTHVAGIIADLTPSNVNLLVLKVSNNGTSSSLIMDLALEYAVQENVDVVNMSFGFICKDASSYSFLDGAINRAYRKGIPVCVAAGNQTVDPSLGMTASDLNVNYCYPACNDQAISVSALDTDMTLADYSFRSNNAQKKIDFTAPGTSIVSAGISQKTYYTATMSGTSMAAPHITAAMAYIKMMNKNLSVQGASLELRKYCIDLGSSGKDAYYGYGYPNLTGLFQQAVTYSNMTVSSQLASPTITSCYNGKKGTVVKWSSVSGASGYYLYRRKNGGGNKKLATFSATTRSYTDKSLSEGDYAVYYVVAYRNNGLLSGKSDIVDSICLKTVSVKSIKAAGSKKLSVKIKNKRIWAGKKIEIQYSSSRTFLKKTSKKFYAYYSKYSLKSNRKGTTYVRMRSVFTYGGKTFYSAWSTVKKLKVK